METLIDNLKQAKHLLAVAQDAVFQAETAIYNTVKDELPEKGTTHFDGIKIVTGFYEKWDDGILNTIEKQWILNVPFPFKNTYKADAKAISYIKENFPHAYEEVRKALSLTPKKPHFEIKE